MEKFLDDETLCLFKIGYPEPFSLIPFNIYLPDSQNLPGYPLC